MNNWQSETSRYLSRLEQISEILRTGFQHPEQILMMPDKAPTPLQATLSRATVFLEVGAWKRTEETVDSILCLWKEGYLSSVGSLSRLLFELWAVAHHLKTALTKYKDNKELDRLSKVVNKIFEGVKSDVFMPWGMQALEQPIHVMDTIRSLQSVYPEALDAYNDLCESAHANQPRYFEWLLLGKIGDNWTNPTVQKRGHDLLDKTVLVIDRSVKGIKTSVDQGLQLCGKLY